MLTSEDIQKLTEYQKTIFATRSEVATKDDIKAVMKRIDLLAGTVDSFSKEILINRSERTVLSYRMDKYDRWFKVLADKTGAQLTE